jgi:hypothetical protein
VLGGAIQERSRIAKRTATITSMAQQNAMIGIATPEKDILSGSGCGSLNLNYFPNCGFSMKA